MKKNYLTRTENIKFSMKKNTFLCKMVVVKNAHLMQKLKQNVLQCIYFLSIWNYLYYIMVQCTFEFCLHIHCLCRNICWENSTISCHFWWSKHLDFYTHTNISPMWFLFAFLFRTFMYLQACNLLHKCLLVLLKCWFQFFWKATNCYIIY